MITLLKKLGIAVLKLPIGHDFMHWYPIAVILFPNTVPNAASKPYLIVCEVVVNRFKLVVFIVEKLFVPVKVFDDARIDVIICSYCCIP